MSQAHKKESPILQKKGMSMRMPNRDLSFVATEQDTQDTQDTTD